MSTAQLTPAPPSAPLLQFGSVEVVPAMKLEKAAWSWGLELVLGRGWRPV